MNENIIKKIKSLPPLPKSVMEIQKITADPNGSIADFTSFSFHAVKNLTTAEGGAVVWKVIDGIDNEDIYRDYMVLTLHGQTKDALAKTKLGAWEYDIIAPN